MGITSKTIEKGPGFAAVVKRAEDLAQYTLQVGVFDMSTHPDSDLSVVDIAAIHEYGSLDGRIPARSFIRGTLEANKDRYAETLSQVALNAISLEKGTKEGMTALGEMAKAQITTAFDFGGTEGAPWKPLADSTEERKARMGYPADEPLVATGKLRDSIDFKVVKAGGAQ